MLSVLKLTAQSSLAHNRVSVRCSGTFSAFSKKISKANLSLSSLRIAQCDFFKPQLQQCCALHTSASSRQSEKVSNQDDSLSMNARLKIVAVFLATWCGVYFAAKYNRSRKQLEDRDAEMKQVDIGASDYELIDQDGQIRTKKDFLGRWFLLYFGFTHCPDICPEELDKMAEIIKTIDSDNTVPDLLPVFVSVDPERDTPDVIKKYVSEFHPNFVGLTGTKDQVKQAAKAFRVYFSAGPRDEDNDYIIDHSIVMYLMSPQGNFVDYYGSRGIPSEKIIESIKQNMRNYRRLHG